MTKFLAAEIRYNRWDPPFNTGDPLLPFQSLESILSKVIGFLTVAAILYFLFQIIFAGYSWISAGSDSQKIEQSRNKIWQSLMGISIVVFAVAFAALIGYLVGVDFLDLNSLVEPIIGVPV